MTNNIIAHFASQIDNKGNFIDYHVVSGSVFNEEYNETLDSATIVLSQIPKELRLTKIKPYDYVRVFDASGNTGFDRLYLVDNYDEKENNIHDHIFGYTINLMSETKLLEKIQCPNLVITHGVEDGVITKKTIFEHILRYMELFVPKIKHTEDGETWSYAPLIKVPADNNYHSSSININYTNDNFEYVGGHGVNYLFSCESEQISQSSSTIRYDSVEIVSIETHDGTVVWSDGYTPTGTFDTDRGIFEIIARADNSSNSGYLTVHYRYKLVPTGAFYERFNVPCADLAFNCPTLRQLLTTLMQQVGCIPIVKNRTLGFLDFQKDAVDFAVNGDYSLGYTVNNIRRSLSSDSYVNTLVNMSEQVLDSGNEVICETLCFRDKSNVLLKQKENLCLETSLPIYKVNKCILHGPGKSSGILCSSFNCFYGCAAVSGTWSISPTNDFPFIFYKETSISNGTATIKFRVRSRVVSASEAPRIVANYIYFWSLDAQTGAYHIIDRKPFGTNGMLILSAANVSNTTDTTYYWDTYNEESKPFGSYAYTMEVPNVNSSAVGFFITGRMYSGALGGESKEFTFIRFADDDANVVYHDPYQQMYYNPNSPSTGTLRDHIWSANTDPNYTTSGGAQGVPAVNRFIAGYSLNNLFGFQAWDISKLVVEDSVRQLLDRDFQQMGNEIPHDNSSTWTIDNIAKYVYGTVGYTIGSKEISGFSDVYIAGNQTPLGWIEAGYTYFENIVNVLEKDVTSDNRRKLNLVSTHFEGTSLAYLKVYQYGSYSQHHIGNSTSYLYWDSSSYAVENGNVLNYTFNYYDPVHDNFSSNEKFFTAFFVDLYYQPLNSFNMSYVKANEDVPIPLSQYDSSASGVTDFDRLSINEQEQVDRIGNETLTINQRATSFSQIRTFDNGPLVFKDDVNRDGQVNSSDNSVDYIIFKRSFTINNNCFNVSYVGSKDAVLKNYFTSIRTKYRAYQYVDYNQSVLRKEKDLFYIRVSGDYYDGDDKITFGNSGTTALEQRGLITSFIYDLNNDVESLGNNRNISYEIERDVAKVNTVNGSGESVVTTEMQTIRNSVSAIASKGFAAFVYEYVDNVGAGPYIINIVDDPDLGGVPQAWQIWGEDYNTKHQVSFVSYIDFYDQLNSNISTNPEQKVREQITRIERSPIVDDSYTYNTVFSVVDDNKDSYSNTKRTFYKDYAERINHTVQFIYYSPNQVALIGEHFVLGTPVINRFELSFDALVLTNDFSLKEEPYALSTGESLISNTVISLVTDASNGIPYISLNFGSAGTKKVIKLCHRNLADNTFTDIAVFKRYSTSNLQKYFFMINDTKTDKVFAEKEGMLFLGFEVEKYTSDTETSLSRTCLPLFDNIQHLEYIQNSGTQYINLNIVPSVNYSFVLEYTDVSASGSNYVMGSRTGAGATIYAGVTGASATSTITVANTDLSLNNYRVANVRYRVTANYTSDWSGSFELYDETRQESHTGRQNATLAGATAHVCVFALNSSNIHSGMKVHSLKIWKDGVLYRDLIPAKKNNVLGLYDRVTGGFYSNSGTGTFVAGPVVND